MKKLLVIVAVAMASTTLNTVKAQELKTIKLEQTPGEFTVKGLTITEGTYIFEVRNNGVDHPVGFGLATVTQPDVEHALAVITNGGRGLNDGESDTTEPITLKPGKYVYWCPANPTEQYKLIVSKKE